MKKVTALFTVSLLCVSCLSGCFPTGEPVNVPTPSLSSGVINSSSKKQDNNTKSPTSVKKQLAENLFVDASVSVPANANWKKCEVKMKSWDVDFVTQQLFGSKQVRNKEEYAHDLYANMKNINIDGKDGSNLGLKPGTILFDEKDFLDFGYSFFIHDLLTFRSFKDINFSKQTLDNVNKEQAIALVKEKVKALGLTVEENPTVTAMDVDSMNAQMDYTYMKDKKGKEMHHWTVDDQAYVITFHVMQDGLPITQTGYVTSSVFATGTRLLAVVGTKGLLSFSLQSAYEIAGAPQTVGKLISLDTVFEKIKEKYKNVLLTSPVTVHGVRLEYVPTTKDVKTNKFTLSPMWICITEQTTVTADANKGSVNAKSQFPIYFDAVTGSEMEIQGQS